MGFDPQDSNDLILLDQPTAEEEEETVTIGISEFDFLRDELSYLRFELADQRREAREDKLLAN